MCYVQKKTTTTTIKNLYKERWLIEVNFRNITRAEVIKNGTPKCNIIA